MLRGEEPLRCHEDAPEEAQRGKDSMKPSLKARMRAFKGPVAPISGAEIPNALETLANGLKERTMTPFRFHLLGGVSEAEALGVQKHHGHRWAVCGKCTAPAEAVMLLRRPSGHYGDVEGSPLCAIHEAEFLKLVRESPGYLGSTSR